MCSLAHEQLPNWMLVGVTVASHPKGNEYSVAVRRPFSSEDKKVLSLSDKFSEVQTLQRLAVWSDLALGWGLMCPWIAVLGFLYLDMELWCHKKANRHHLQLKIQNIKQNHRKHTSNSETQKH